jgi:translation initiation factor 5B
MRLGVVENIEHNYKKIPEARKKNGSVAISLTGESNIMAGRHFDQKDMLVSIISRKSIDLLAEHFGSEVTQEECQLIVDLKKYFNIA